MRLLHTTNIRQQEFSDGEVPKYAILSHRWVEDEEITNQAFNEGRLLDRPGWAKIQRSCKIAKSLKHDWIWIDTCCIDRSSSTELSEAINSMFYWYRNAEVCLTYLCDVRKDSNSSRTFKIKGSSKDSEWFRRGWTLQEFLAPQQLSFYDMEWNYLGTRSRAPARLCCGPSGSGQELPHLTKLESSEVPLLDQWLPRESRSACGICVTLGCLHAQSPRSAPAMSPCRLDLE